MKEKPQITALPADKLLSTAEVAEHAERCIMDVYRETGRGASLDDDEEGTL